MVIPPFKRSRFIYYFFRYETLLIVDIEIADNEIIKVLYDWLFCLSEETIDQAKKQK